MRTFEYALTTLFALTMAFLIVHYVVGRVVAVMDYDANMIAASTSSQGN